MTELESSKMEIGAALAGPIPAIAYRLSEGLRSLFPNRALIEGESCSFDLSDFAAAGHCTLTDADPAVYNQLDTDWIGPGKGLSRTPLNAWYAVEWEGHSLDVLLLSWPQGYSKTDYHWILADTVEIAERFFTAVCEMNAVIDETVLVFDGGGWQKSRDLFRAIRSATFENLVLPATLKREIRSDIERFFASRETYEKYGVPWKRGILLVGPPGNGKTHMVKALINSTGAACLYVKSFKSQHGTDHDSIRSVFHRARQTTPCVLVLEDLDSLIDDGNRSFFLNELDGFASNVGIVTLASTNHPERLDTAIVDRPSRFDRKYHFDLPALPERRAYIQLWNGELQSELHLTDAGLDNVAVITDGFSFAYLKELFLTCLMAWINESELAGPKPMDEVAVEQVALLRTQMASMNRPAAPIAEDLTTGDTDEE